MAVARIDPHAADRIDRGRHDGLVGIAMLAAAAGMNRRRGAVVMAGLAVLRACAWSICAIQTLRGPLNYIP